MWHIGIVTSPLILSQTLTIPYLNLTFLDPYPDLIDERSSTPYLRNIPGMLNLISAPFSLVTFMMNALNYMPPRWRSATAGWIIICDNAPYPYPISFCQAIDPAPDQFTDFAPIRRCVAAIWEVRQSMWNLKCAACPCFVTILIYK